MGNRSEEFFEWLRSINKLEIFESALETSIDFSGDQKHRLEASDLLMVLDRDFIKYSQA
tara:strand:- start:496 stop:672 length:177 start_codon:yes stop_codon:yes gene_type:complete